MKWMFGVTGLFLVVLFYQRTDRMIDQFWEEYRGEARLPLELNPVCATPRSHEVKVRIDGDYDVGSDGLPIVSIYAVMRARPDEEPGLVRSCMVPLPYTHMYTSKTCDPYRFSTYGVRNGMCQVWIDGVLQPGCDGWVMPEGVAAVLP